MHVELVHTEAADGVRLDGYLRAPTAPSSSLGIDAVICHHGVGGAFYTPAFFDTMGDRLLEAGVAVLRVNNRGHDGIYHLGPRRLGAAYEVLDDARLDFRAWCDLAAGRGYRRLAIWGHSLGAVKTVYVAAVEPDERVVCAIASSPPRFVHQAYVDSSDGQRFLRDIAAAQASVDAGQPEALIEALIPQPRAFSARTLLDKYGPRARYDYFQYLPQVRMPLLLTLGSLETPDVSFAPLAQRGPSMSDDSSVLTYSLIDGADHFYTSRTDPLWSAASQFFQSVAAPDPLS